MCIGRNIVVPHIAMDVLKKKNRFTISFKLYFEMCVLHWGMCTLNRRKGIVFQNQLLYVNPFTTNLAKERRMNLEQLQISMNVLLGTKISSVFLQSIY